MATAEAREEEAMEVEEREAATAEAEREAVGLDSAATAGVWREALAEEAY